MGEGRLGWDVEGWAEGGGWERCLGGERGSREAEDFEGEGVWACGLGGRLGHGGCSRPFGRRYTDKSFCPGLSCLSSLQVST